MEVVRTINAFLDFYYIARTDAFTRQELDALDNALYWFQKYRTIFQEVGVRSNNTTAFSLPRQHAMAHYRLHIENFGAPTGLCTSTPESKHKLAVKRPWRRSNRCEALKQILLTNERNDKLASAHTDFKKRGMLEGTAITDALRRVFSSEGYNLPPPVLPSTPSISQLSQSPEDDEEDVWGPDDESVSSEVILGKARGTQYSDVGVSPILRTDPASHYP